MARRTIGQKWSRSAGLSAPFAHGQIDQQDGQRRFVHLDAVPVGRAVQPHVLGPVAVGFLGHLQIAEDAPGIVERAGGEEAAGRLPRGRAARPGGSRPGRRRPSRSPRGSRGWR